MNFVRAIIGAAEESIKGTFTKTTSGEEKRTNLSTATHILPDNYTLLGANNLNIAAGGNLNIAAEQKITIKSIQDMKLETEANMDVDGSTIDMDASSSMTVDAPTLSIDGPAGNITSNEVTLHTHKHSQPNTGADATSQGDTNEPVSGT